MLSHEDNEALTRVGPGTLMGSFLREYWMPAMLSSELPHPDCDPVRVLLLGEQLIGFRDTNGRPGLISNLCPHRGASLFFGRNEDCGIRCVYHGWKFDVDGNCVDMPNEPAESNFKNRIKATTYPCVERGGLVWAYLGSRSTPPPLPGLEATLLPDDDLAVNARMQPSNWVQALEGDIDTVHAAFLHGGHLEPEWYDDGTFSFYEINERSPRFAALDTTYGAIYGASRPAGEGRNYWRIGQYFYPCWTSPAPGVLGHKISDTCWAPMDDTHTMVFNVRSKSRRNPAAFTIGQSDTNELLPNTTDWFGRFRPVYTLENDFLIDREEQRELGSYSGMPFGNNPEDSGVQVSMGPVLDRRIEHLGTSDLMIIRVRQLLLQAARAFADEHTPPPGLDDPDSYGVRSGGAFVPADADWFEYLQELLPAFVEHPELDAEALQGGRIGKGRRHRRGEVTQPER